MFMPGSMSACAGTGQGLLSPGRGRDRSTAGGVGVIVAVGLPEMLGVGVDVRLVVVFHDRVVVLMRVGGRHGLAGSCGRDRACGTGSRSWRHGGNLATPNVRAPGPMPLGTLVTSGKATAPAVLPLAVSATGPHRHGGVWHRPGRCHAGATGPGPPRRAGRAGRPLPGKPSRVLSSTARGQGRSSSRSLRSARPGLRSGFGRGQRPRLRLGRRHRSWLRFRFGFWRGQRLRPGCRGRCRRFRPWPGRRPRRRRRVRQPRLPRRVRDRQRLGWSGPGRFRRFWLGRGGIAGCLADRRAGGLCWHLEMIPRPMPATRHGGGCAWPNRLARWPGVAHWCHVG